jgi:hypothetical protein
MTVIDPQTWKDAEDGRALRELREAAAKIGHHVTLVQEPGRWTVRVINPNAQLVARCDAFDVLAKNADACREALVKP